MQHGMPVYPRSRNNVVQQPDTIVAPEWVNEALRVFHKSISDLTNLIEDTSHRVDEYRVQSLTGETDTTFDWLPDYEEFDEIIEAIIVTGPTITAQVLGNSQTQRGTITSPGAGATVASTTVPAGTYQVNWTVQLAGTVGAADANNFLLNLPNTGSVNQGAVGNYPQLSQELVLTTTTNVTITAIGAATVGAIYTGEFSLIPISIPASTGTPFTLKLGKRSWNLELPANGILTIAPVKISLGRNSDRHFASATPGNWSVELCGYADIGYRFK